MKGHRFVVGVALLSGIGVAAGALLDVGPAQAAGGSKTVRCVGDTKGGIAFRIAFVHNPGKKIATVTSTEIGVDGNVLGTPQEFTIQPGGTAFRVAAADGTAVQHFASKSKLIVDGSMGTDSPVDDAQNLYRAVRCD